MFVSSSPQRFLDWFFICSFKGCETECRFFQGYCHNDYNRLRTLSYHGADVFTPIKDKTLRIARRYGLETQRKEFTSRSLGHISMILLMKILYADITKVLCELELTIKRMNISTTPDGIMWDIIEGILLIALSRFQTK
ncbi:hypothetical protein P8452_56877 [Trifolium repens]|nr:hypothetical protein P8452_56877 [Trifolium repens]